MIKVSIFLCALAGIGLTPMTLAQTPPISKKGVGFWNADNSFNAYSPFVDQLGCGWYYNWTPVPDAAPAKIEAQFVPMIWGTKDASKKNLARLKESGAPALLGFNEPDAKEQADMTVDEALALWPRLMETGLRLGSPAPANAAKKNSWLERFMTQTDSRGYRVDFICLHWYGDITAPDAVDQLKTFLETQWERYRRPIWLTEFAGSTGPWLKILNPPVNPEKNAAFIRKALPMLESLPFLERYAWFELKWNEPPWADVALFHPHTKTITVAGRAYQAIGSSSSNEAKKDLDLE